MHTSSILRMKWFVDNYAERMDKETIKVLDVGSYDVNGSYKHLFDGKNYQYTGLDMEEGPNVDIVLNSPYDWNKLGTDAYDIVISGQAFEHIEFFWITMSEMTRVLNKGGLMCVIAPKGFDEHRFPVDCYRFFSDGMIALARYVSIDPLHAHTNCAPNIADRDWYSERNADSMLIARKPYSGLPKYVDLKNYQCTPVDQEDIRTGLLPYVRKDVTSIKGRLWRRIKRL